MNDILKIDYDAAINAVHETLADANVWAVPMMPEIFFGIVFDQIAPLLKEIERLASERVRRLDAFCRESDADDSLRDKEIAAIKDKALAQISGALVSACSSAYMYVAWKTDVTSHDFSEAVTLERMTKAISKPGTTTGKDTAAAIISRLRNTLETTE